MEIRSQVVAFALFVAHAQATELVRSITHRIIQHPHRATLRAAITYPETQLVQLRDYLVGTHGPAGSEGFFFLPFGGPDTRSGDPCCWTCRAHFT